MFDPGKGNVHTFIHDPFLQMVKGSKCLLYVVIPPARDVVKGTLQALKYASDCCERSLMSHLLSFFCAYLLQDNMLLDALDRNEPSYLRLSRVFCTCFAQD